MSAKSWSLASVTASTVTTLIAPEATPVDVAAGMIITNSSSSDATVSAWITDGSDTILAVLIPAGTIAAGEPGKFAAPFTVNPGHKVRVSSTESATSFVASGWVHE